MKAMSTYSYNLVVSTVSRCVSTLSGTNALPFHDITYMHVNVLPCHTRSPLELFVYVENLNSFHDTSPAPHSL